MSDSIGYHLLRCRIYSFWEVFLVLFIPLFWVLQQISICNKGHTCSSRAWCYKLFAFDNFTRSNPWIWPLGNKFWEAFSKWIITTLYIYIYFYYVKIQKKIPGELSRDDLLSSHEKRLSLLWLHNRSRLSERKWNYLVFHWSLCHKWNITPSLDGIFSFRCADWWHIVLALEEKKTYICSTGN